MAQLVAWPLALVLAEFVWRAMLAARGEPYSAERTARELETIERASREFVPGGGRTANDGSRRAFENRTVIHPYAGYELAFGMDQLDAERHFVATRPRDSYYGIAILGGSVAQMFAQFGGDRLIEVLQRDPRFHGRAIHRFQFARGGYRQPQQLSTLAWLVTLGFEFDLVIVLDGFNEVAIARQNHASVSHAAFPSVLHWSHLVSDADFHPEQIEALATIRAAQRSLVSWATTASEWRLHRSAIAGAVCLRRVASLRVRATRGMEQYMAEVVRPSLSDASRGPQIASDHADPVVTAVGVWAEASRNARALCEGLGMRYVHFLQPTLHDPGAKPISAKEREVGVTVDEWLAGVAQGYPLLRESGAELAREGEAFHDLSRVFASVEDTLYIDSCHVNARGNERLADAVGDALLATLPADVGPNGLRSPDYGAGDR